MHPRLEPVAEVKFSYMPSTHKESTLITFKVWMADRWKTHVGTIYWDKKLTTVSFHAEIWYLHFKVLDKIHGFMLSLKDGNEAITSGLLN